MAHYHEREREREGERGRERGEGRRRRTKKNFYPHKKGASPPSSLARRSSAGFEHETLGFDYRLLGCGCLTVLLLSISVTIRL